MKSYCKGLVINEGMVRAAYERWRAAPAGRKNTHRVVSEYGSPDRLITEIAREIRRRELTLRPIRYYRHHGDGTSGKTRRIGVQSVKQQVLDYIAVAALEPLLTAKVGFYQVSSVAGKGQLFTARTVRRWSQAGGYWVHLDVRQCYPSISHEVVTRILERHVRSEDVLYVCQTLLGTYDRGLAIGSYWSLRMAQLVLSYGYHHVEDLHKVRRGIRRRMVSHQLWYMDDVLLMAPGKRDLRMAARSLERYLASEVGLHLKPWKVCRVGDREPIDMAGYVVRPDRTTVRSGIFLRARRSVRRYHRRPTLAGARRVCAYWGWLAHSDSAGHVRRSRAREAHSSARALISAHERSHHP